LACLQHGDVALALVDYAMPGMSGTEFMQRAQQQCQGLPVVFVTGSPDALAAQAAIDVPVLSKPYTRASLAESMRLALQP
jgi:CheY-like chemotaxis protein